MALPATAPQSTIITEHGRNFIQTLKDAFREPHPFARKTAILKPHIVPWLSVYAKRQLLTASLFVPVAVVVFGWPLAAKAFVEWNNGVHKAAPMRSHKATPIRSHKATRRMMLQEGPIKQAL